MSTLEERGSARSSVVGHFRMSKRVYESLEEEARKGNVSLNTLVNQLLSSHVRDDWVFEEVGFVRMPKDAFREILSAIPDSKLAELGRGAVKTGRDTMMLARSGGITLDAILEDLRFLSRCGWCTIHETKVNGKTVITMAHDFGARHSVMVAADAANIFGLVGIHPKITTTHSSVVIEY